MDSKLGFIAARHITGDGRASRLEDNIADEVLSEKKLTWIHLDANEENSRLWLFQNINYLDDIIINALLEKETNPRILEHTKGVLIILRLINTIPGEDAEDMVSVRLWIDKYRIISAERRASKIVDKFETLFNDSRGPKNSGEFMTSLIDMIIKSSEPLVQVLEDEIDDTEQLFIDSPSQLITKQILQTRKKALVLKRNLSPQRQVIFNLKTFTIDWINSRQNRLLHEQYERMQRIIESLDLVRERSQIISDEVNNISSAQMNTNLYILSIITSIFLPVSFLTGLFGINVGGIPWEAEPFGFWFFSGFVGFFIIFIFAALKLKKWF